MSPNQFIVGASAAAVALLMNSPFCDAIKSIAPDDPAAGYPKQVGRSRFNSMRNATHCHFSNEKHLTSSYASLDIYIKYDVVQTDDINCPATERWPAFRAVYSGRPAVQSYANITYPTSEEDWCTFEDHFPFNNTGLDPLRELNQSPLRDARNKVYAAARKVKFTRERAILWEGKVEGQTEAQDELISEFKDACSVAIETIRKQFGPFPRLCGKYRDASEEAIAAATLEKWYPVRIRDHVTQLMPSKVTE
ncbi:hypothetical protein FOZ60_009795 [Perkinsus olseni]|uniref:Uncharacterized protein n=1 Tax=Perkinsus olseni TaxID=32597 RepID=A0A7J6NGF2_PEROL|nr:hypothetical protein FOZ60_009795 [Perkinsus olseni]